MSTQRRGRRHWRFVRTPYSSTHLRDRKYPVAFDNLPEVTVCSPEYYGEFAHYLAHVYRIKKGSPGAGDFLAVGTVLSYLCLLINRAAAKYRATGDASSKLFFTCLDTHAKTDAAKWLLGVKAKLTREIFQRQLKAGTLSDGSETPIYGIHFRAIVSSRRMYVVCSVDHHYPFFRHR